MEAQHVIMQCISGEVIPYLQESGINVSKAPCGRSRVTDRAASQLYILSDWSCMSNIYMHEACPLRPLNEQIDVRRIVSITFQCLHLS